MKNIYKITKGQLISLWFFGIIAWVYSVDSYSDFSGFLSILIPAILVFYTIGWRSNRDIREPIVGISSDKVMSGIGKLLKFIVPTIIVIGVLIFMGIKFSEGKEVREARQNYIGIFNRYDKNLENAKSCLEERNPPLIKQYTDECKARYEQAYLSYTDCKKDMPWQSHNQCLNWFGSNYEAIDCSKETMFNKANSINEIGCYSVLKDDFAQIISFEQEIAGEFLDSYPKTKATFSQVEIQKLYDLFPAEVFNEKTKDRLNNFVESKGYTIEQ